MKTLKKRMKKKEEEEKERSRREKEKVRVKKRRIIGRRGNSERRGRRKSEQSS